MSLNKKSELQQSILDKISDVTGVLATSIVINFLILAMSLNWKQQPQPLFNFLRLGRRAVQTYAWTRDK